MRKDDVDKEPSTLYIEKDLKFLAKSREINLSGLVNDLLRTYFSVGSKDEIFKEIEKHRDQLAVLEKKLKEFETVKVKEKTVSNVKEDHWDHAFDVFSKRMDGDTGETMLFQWVKHSKACAPLLSSGLKIEEIIAELKRRYHGL